jgi:hypothetical protein
MNEVCISWRVLQLVRPEERPELVARVEELQRRWRDLLARAPPHLMRLEFRLDDALLHHCIKDIHRELAYEEQVRTISGFSLASCS